MGKQLALLGYSWIESRLEAHLLQFASHKNVYQKMKSQRKVELKNTNYKGSPH